MKTWLKYIVLFLYGTSFLYLSNLFEIPKNIYYFMIGVPIFIGIGFVIVYLFEKKRKTTGN
ncbi:hypothetical protein PGLA_07430 [Paenibacillus glacialis]|uniref:Uncharacterized protein n=1 Tax=Paenibacillus glacialis TaxID=494026 RepID=A0A168MBL3_9BACL|nr:hypothetical protein PGLA_07430 [Paenibacillus glacialis]